MATERRIPFHPGIRGKAELLGADTIECEMKPNGLVSAALANKDQVGQAHHVLAAVFLATVEEVFSAGLKIIWLRPKRA